MLHQPTTLPRGVYRAPWLGPNGQTVFVAVNADGRLVAEGFALPGQDPEPALEEMRATLDRDDPPRPPLRLVS